MLVMFVIYLCVAVLLALNMRKLDFMSLLKDVSPSVNERVERPPTRKVESPRYENLTPDPAFPESEIPVDTDAMKRTGIEFDTLDDVLAYARTLDGTLNSASPVLPYFARRQLD